MNARRSGSPSLHRKRLKLDVPPEDREMGSKRELISPKGDKRLIRRDEQGRIKESDDLGRSLSQDVRKPARHASPSGQGDRGDRKPH